MMVKRGERQSKGGQVGKFTNAKDLRKSLMETHWLGRYFKNKINK